MRLQSVVFIFVSLFPVAFTANESVSFLPLEAQKSFLAKKGLIDDMTFSIPFFDVGNDDPKELPRVLIRFFTERYKAMLAKIGRFGEFSPFIKTFNEDWKNVSTLFNLNEESKQILAKELFSILWESEKYERLVEFSHNMPPEVFAEFLLRCYNKKGDTISCFKKIDLDLLKVLAIFGKNENTRKAYTLAMKKLNGQLKEEKKSKWPDIDLVLATQFGKPRREEKSEKSPVIPKDLLEILRDRYRLKFGMTAPSLCTLINSDWKGMVKFFKMKDEWKKQLGTAIFTILQSDQEFKDIQMKVASCLPAEVAVEILLPELEKMDDDSLFEMIQKLIDNDPKSQAFVLAAYRLQDLGRIDISDN